jgi:hypothetical protein
MRSIFDHCSYFGCRSAHTPRLRQQYFIDRRASVTTADAAAAPLSGADLDNKPPQISEEAELLADTLTRALDVTIRARQNDFKKQQAENEPRQAEESSTIRMVAQRLYAFTLVDRDAPAGDRNKLLSCGVDDTGFVGGRKPVAIQKIGAGFGGKPFEAMSPWNDSGGRRE